MLDQKISKGDELHTIAPEDDGKKKLITISGVFILVAVVAVAGFIIKKTSYTPLPKDWGPKDLTPAQRQQIFSSLPKTVETDSGTSTPDELTVSQKNKIFNSLPKQKTQDKNSDPSTLTKEQKDQLFKSLFATQ